MTCVPPTGLSLETHTSALHQGKFGSRQAETQERSSWKATSKCKNCLERLQLAAEGPKGCRMDAEETMAATGHMEFPHKLPSLIQPLEASVS